MRTDWESFPCEAPRALRATFQGEEKRPDSPQHTNTAETQLLVLDGLQWKGKTQLEGSEVALIEVTGKIVFSLLSPLSYSKSICIILSPRSITANWSF